MPPEHDLPLEEYRRTGREITNGNPEVYKPLYSRRDDATLANPFGPPVRGWSDVSATLDRAAPKRLEGRVQTRRPDHRAASSRVGHPELAVMPTAHVDLGQRPPG